MNGIARPLRTLGDGMSFVVALAEHRALLLQMVRRDLTEQHAGHLLGGLWAVLHPLFLIGVYLFVFSVVFKTRIGGTYELPLDYTAYMLSGLIPWLATQQSLIKSCTAITGNAALVKQVVFPLEVLPAKAVLATLVGQAVSLGVLIVYVLATQRSLPWTYVLLPLVVALQTVGLLGVGLMMSAAGVYLRDLKEVVQLYGFAGMFLLPVVYLPDWVPPIFRPILYLNPASYMVWCYQDVLYFGRFQHPGAWVVFVAGSVACLGMGARAFHWMKHLFGDAL